MINQLCRINRAMPFLFWKSGRGAKPHRLPFSRDRLILQEEAAFVKGNFDFFTIFSPSFSHSMVFSTEMVGEWAAPPWGRLSRVRFWNPFIFVDFVQFAGSVFMDFEYIFHG